MRRVTITNSSRWLFVFGRFTEAVKAPEPEEIASRTWRTQFWHVMTRTLNSIIVEASGAADASLTSELMDRNLENYPGDCSSMPAFT